MVGRRGILALVISVALLIGIGVMVQTVSALEYVTVTYPNGGENVTGTITITWDSNSTAIDTIYIQYSDDGGDQYHPIDSVAGDERSYDWDTTSVADGTLYKIRIIVYDSLNSTQVMDTSDDNFTIDNTPPISSVDSILPYWQTTSPITITVTATDTTSGVSNVTLWYRFSTDNSSWGDWTYFGKDTNGADGWSFDFDFPSEGYYEFYSIANDSVGNTEPAPTEADAICGYDTTAPTSSVNPISPYWNTTGSVTITVTATDATSGVSNVTLWYRYRANNESEWSDWTYFGKDTSSPWSFDFTFPEEGCYEFYSIANDTAGNTETKSPSAEAICGYDATGPTVTITFPEDEAFYNTPILNVNGTASDTLSGVKVVKVSLVNQSTGAWWDFRNGIWQTSGSPQVYNATGTDSWDLNSTTAPYWPSWSDGTTYEFHAFAFDNAGNIGTVAVSTFTYDITAPTSSVDPISPYWNTTGSVTITATASDTLSGLKNVSLYYYYSADNSTWEGPCLFGTNETPWVGISWNFTFPNGTGYYRFYSIAIDNASNVEEFDGNDTMCGFDNTTPKPVILIPVDGAYYNSLDNISGYATDELSGIKSVSIAINNLTNNTGWIWSLPNGSWTTGEHFYSAYLNTSSGALNVTWWYSENWIPTWANGKVYKVKCRVYDLAGNVNYTEVTFTYDTEEPQSFIKGETVAPPYWHNASITISVTAQDYGTHASGVSNVTLWYRYRPDNSSSWGNWTYFGKNESGTDHIWNFTFDFPSGEGHYQFYSVANDTAGNTETVDVANLTNLAECGYDATGPNVTITFPENGVFYNTPILYVTGKVSDNLSSVESVQVLIENITGMGIEGDIYIWNWSSGRWDLETEGLSPSYYFELAVVDVDDETWYLNNETASSWPNWEDGQTYGIYVYALDVAGNDNDSEASFTYDTTAPTSWIHSKNPDKYWYTSGDLPIWIHIEADDGELNESTYYYLNTSLWYKYSPDNETWTDWIFYGYAEYITSWYISFDPPQGDGFYQLMTIARDPAGNVENKTDPDPNGSIGVDTTLPEIEITTPEDGGYYAFITNITGYVYDATSGVKSVHVQILDESGYYWNGATWSSAESWLTANLIYENDTNNSAIWYIDSNLPSWENTKEYTVKAYAVDMAINFDADRAAVANFTILRLNLKEGWNLVSVPRELENPSIEAVFEGITTVDRIYYYDPTSGWKWAIYSDGSWDTSGGLTTIDDGKGYWIHATAETNVTLTLEEINPLETPPTYQVKAGWNLIGYTTLSLETSTPIDAYLQNLYTGFGSKWTKLYRYTPGTGYEMATPWYTDYFDTFDLTRGYWLYCSEDGEIVP